MAEETEQTPTTRTLTPEETNKPILAIQGEQALMGADTVDAEGATVPGQFDLGQAELKPIDQAVQTDELMTTTGKTLDAAGVNQSTDPAALPTSITSPTQPNAAQISDVATTQSAMTNATAATGSLSSDSKINVADVTDNSTAAQMLDRGSLAVAKTATLADEAKVNYQLNQIMASLDSDAEMPAWASANMRKVKAIMNQRGLGQSSMAAAAMTQAMMESALPIAAADAQSYSRIQLQNLTNDQQTALSNAATIAAMDRQNLDNRMKAAQQNATSFLQMDIANLNNQQAANILTYQSKVQSLFTDAAAQNAAKQFNATSQNQVNQFYDKLGVSVADSNATREASINTFNVDQVNSMRRYNAKMQDSREQFNSNMQNIIDQSNATWRRTINTANTAAQNSANQFNAQTVLGLSTQAQNNLWQKYRDEASMAYNASQSELQRAHAIAITAIANQFTADMFETKLEASAAEASSAALASIVTEAFKVGKSILSRDAASSATNAYENVDIPDFLGEGGSFSGTGIENYLGTTSGTSNTTEIDWWADDIFSTPSMDSITNDEDIIYNTIMV
mgnify:CR=1 FL=1